MRNEKVSNGELMNSQNIDKVSSASPSRRIWQRYLLVGFMGLLILATMWYAMSKSSQVAKQYSPLAMAAEEIKLNAALAHLWFEEIVSGDKSRDIEEVWRYLDSAVWFAQVMLDGGQNEEGTYIPLDDPALRQNILEVIEKIRDFRAIAEQRLATSESSATGSEIDQRFDAVFDSLLEQADLVEAFLQQTMARDIRRFDLVQAALLILICVLTIIVGLILHRFQRRQTVNMAQLRASNQQLSASEQQLKASNQQLSASEQQLKASNQQLTASEQQLKASNQQLSASEQQLKAANSDLRRSQQKLALHIKQTPLAVIGWNLDFEVTEWNKSAERIFGFTREEAMGRHAAGLIIPASAREIVDKIWSDLLAQKGGMRSTNENLTKANETIMCEWYNTPLIDDEVPPVQWTG